MAAMRRANLSDWLPGAAKDLPNLDQDARDYDEFVAKKKKGEAIQAILLNLYDQEKDLIDDDEETPARVKTLRSQELKVLEKLRLAGVPSLYNLHCTEREYSCMLQLHHDNLIMAIKAFDDTPSDGAAEALEEIRTCIGGLVKCEKSQVMAFFKQRSEMPKAHKVLFDSFTKSDGYKPTCSTEYNNDREDSIKYFIEEADCSMTGRLQIALQQSVLAAIMKPDRAGVNALPETFFLDRKHFLKLNRNFEVGVLALTAIFILGKIPVLAKRQTLTVSHTIEKIAEAIVDQKLRFEDFDHVVEVALHAFKDSFNQSETTKNEIRDGFVSGFLEDSFSRQRAFGLMRLFAITAHEYRDEFIDARSTVKIFKKLKIPLEAGCIRTLLHVQGRTVRTIFKIQNEIFPTFYFSAVCDAMMAVYCNYPLRVLGKAEEVFMVHGLDDGWESGAQEQWV
jgi:hypothetical protein